MISLMHELLLNELKIWNFQAMVSEKNQDLSY